MKNNSFAIMSFAIFRKRIIIVHFVVFERYDKSEREIRYQNYVFFCLLPGYRIPRCTAGKNTFVFRWRVKILVFSPVRAHRSHWSANNCGTRSNGTVIRRSFLFRENKMKSVSIKRRDKFSDISQLAPFSFFIKKNISF